MKPSETSWSKLIPYQNFGNESDQEWIVLFLVEFKQVINIKNRIFLYSLTMTKKQKKSLKEPQSSGSSSPFDFLEDECIGMMSGDLSKCTFTLN